MGWNWRFHAVKFTRKLRIQSPNLPGEPRVFQHEIVIQTASASCQMIQSDLLNGSTIPKRSPAQLPGVYIVVSRLETLRGHLPMADC